ncbi:hypothetical protein AVEN_131854-1 [Araneus ventricosus]|uniref:Uncharacterized protein n=1 Tax=Araneus ventricosus TaxID=182803 RepID=A0A4Y2UHL0_ARAVE|nr:hypothetical protein AVEN_147188-1 [Araneus ventricosus]GBO12569.1 hypothetical protein AVEN_131854-1 [Araneus ventricosus]
MTRTTPELAPPSPNFRATPVGGRLATTYDLACNRPHTRRIFSGIGFRPCGPEVETLPLGHRGHWNVRRKKKQNKKTDSRIDINKSKGSYYLFSCI